MLLNFNYTTTELNTKVKIVLKKTSPGRISVLKKDYLVRALYESYCVKLNKATIVLMVQSKPDLRTAKEFILYWIQHLEQCDSKTKQQDLFQFP